VEKTSDVRIFRSLQQNLAGDFENLREYSTKAKMDSLLHAKWRNCRPPRYLRRHHGVASAGASGSCASHTRTRLLQLTPSRSATVHAGTSSTRLERRSTSAVKLNARDHVTASLIQLHWLPVHWRIQFKLCCIMRSVLWQLPHILN